MIANDCLNSSQKISRSIMYIIPATGPVNLNIFSESRQHKGIFSSSRMLTKNYPKNFRYGHPIQDLPLPIEDIYTQPKSIYFKGQFIAGAREEGIMKRKLYETTFPHKNPTVEPENLIFFDEKMKTISLVWKQFYNEYKNCRFHLTNDMMGISNINPIKKKLLRSLFNDFQLHYLQPFQEASFYNKIMLLERYKYQLELFYNTWDDIYWCRRIDELKEAIDCVYPCLINLPWSEFSIMVADQMAITTIY
jgi:hypothetical protein